MYNKRDQNLKNIINNNEELDSEQEQLTIMDNEKLDFNVKKYYSHYDLLQLDVVKQYKGWSNVPEAIRTQLLWSLGLNTRDHGYYEIDCKHRRIGSNVIVFGTQILSEERTDPEWINMRVSGRRVASLEAQMAAKNDNSLNQEIRKVSGGQLGV